MLGLVGLPLFYMEVALGQYASLGPISIWRINPLFKGKVYEQIRVIWVINPHLLVWVCFYFGLELIVSPFLYPSLQVWDMLWSSCPGWSGCTTTSLSPMSCFTCAPRSLRNSPGRLVTMNGIPRTAECTTTSKKARKVDYSLHDL